MSFYDSTHTGPQIDDAIDIVAERLTTVGTPGSDNSIVSEQGIREALDLKLNKGTSLVLREHVLIAGSTEYPTIQSAINAASSPSSTNRYTVLVLPGLYTEQITMVDYVDLVGMDRLSCRIANDNRVIAPVSNTAINNLSVYYPGTNYAIEPTSAIQDFEMQNVYIEALTGIGVRFRSIGGVKHNSVVLTNVGIKARSGILHSYEGYWTMRDCIIQLYGQDYGVNRFGVEFAGGSRCMLFGCNIFSPWAGSGENITGTGDDVYGIYIPSTVTSNDLKIHLYNCNITVRNEDDANVNCIRMMGTNENASVRIFGGRYLCETPIGTKRAFYAGNAGQIELFGPYYKSGTAGGGPIRGWGYESIDNSTFTFVAFDNTVLKDMQCDTINSTTGYQINGIPGVSGTYTTTDGKTVTVTNGIITSIE